MSVRQEGAERKDRRDLPPMPYFVFWISAYFTRMAICMITTAKTVAAMAIHAQPVIIELLKC